MDLIISVKYGNFHIAFYVVFIKNIFMYFNKNVELFMKFYILKCC